MFTVGAVSLGVVPPPVNITPPDSELRDADLQQTVQRLVGDVQALRATVHLTEALNARVLALEERFPLAKSPGSRGAGTDIADEDVPGLSPEVVPDSNAAGSAVLQPADVVLSDNTAALEMAYSRAADICLELRRAETEAHSQISSFKNI